MLGTAVGRATYPCHAVTDHADSPTGFSLAGIRYLTGEDVAACLPALDGQVELAARALRALGSDDAAEMPPKVGVHPRPGALLHAMPAWFRPDDLVGMKWVSAYPGNSACGVPAINGLIVLNDAPTGLPTCVMDASRITTARTSAVSGVAFRLFAPAGARRAAILGAGVQARGHLAHLTRLLPGGELRIYDRHHQRAAAVANEAVRAGFGDAQASSSAREATRDADVILTVGALGSHTQVMGIGWVRPGALVVAVDFATYVAASLAREARAFVVDDRSQFLAYRDSGSFEGYPEPTGTLGEKLAAGERGHASDHGDRGSADDAWPVVVTHLGVGLADVLFAEAVRRTAEERGIGTVLPR